MQRYGRTASGVQRWYCRCCRKSRVRANPSVRFRHRFRLFRQWLCGNHTLDEWASQYAITRRTLQRWFEPFWHQMVQPAVPDCLDSQALILDAVSLQGRQQVVLIGCTPRRVVHWTFAERECGDSWAYFLAPLPQPFAVVCDGQRGLLSAVRGRWPTMPIQRCLIHIIRQTQIKLTRSPKTETGRLLRRLVLDLVRVRTRRQKRRWIRRWRQWCKRYHNFLAERSIGERQNGKRSWWYTHRNLRAVRSLIRNCLPDLFWFVKYPQIPRTSNHVEGGINSRLKELLHRHRGLGISQKLCLASHFLAKKQP